MQGVRCAKLAIGMPTPGQTLLITRQAKLGAADRL